MIRWLANAETKARQGGASAVLRLDRTFTQTENEAVQITARVQGAEGQPAAKALVSVTVEPWKHTKGTPPENKKVISLTPSPSPGLFTATLNPSESGEFLVKLTATDEKGTTLGADELKLKVISRSAELEKLARNDILLRKLAKVSGGRFADLSGLPDLLDTLIERYGQVAAPGFKAKTVRLYHFPILLVCFVACLTLEWILRRSWQLQ
jgi:hypothetical protein